jgi:hypothetical protein
MNGWFVRLAITARSAICLHAVLVHGNVNTAREKSNKPFSRSPSIVEKFRVSSAMRLCLHATPRLFNHCDICMSSSIINAIVLLSLSVLDVVVPVAPRWRSAWTCTPRLRLQGAGGAMVPCPLHSCTISSISARGSIASSFVSSLMRAWSDRLRGMIPPLAADDSVL